MSQDKTVEELQKQILDLQTENEKLQTEKNAVEDKYKASETNLNRAREINMQLWKRQEGGTLPTNNPDNTVDTEVLTPEKALDGLISDAMNPNLKRMRAIYGDIIPEKVEQESIE